MTYIVKPKNHHPNLERNDLGLTRRDYEGGISSLCAGCGHDSISAAIIDACFQLSLSSHQIAKLSGIGCSSKAPAYFLNQSHGFNSVHGRMPSIATGANVANHELLYLGVSGDGDSASIGIGQFIHAARRQPNMIYIVENNGTYGLTKGQFSATNDLESTNKYGDENLFPAIDLCAMAIQLGASFVARGFSGDREQLIPLIKAAINHKGFCLLDIISPCVTFNNHKTSTKSYDHIREHNESVSKPDFVPLGKEITATYSEGENIEVNLHDGSILTLEKLSKEYDPLDKKSALENLISADKEGKVTTGLLYIDPEAKDLKETINMVDTPLNELKEDILCPGQRFIDGINDQLR
ncbi:MAG: 2-oxoacid:ferredoxin oxidoreductase subunit beta [Gammaproteobacteria bacterium]